MELGTFGLPRRLDIWNTDTVILGKQAPLSTQCAALSIGPSPFDNTSSGRYALFGNSGGNYIGINAETGFNGHFINCGVAGSFKFLVAADGHIQCNARCLMPEVCTLLGSVSGTPTSALAAGGTLTIGTTYFYSVTPLDVLGREVARSTETTGRTPTSGNQSVTVTWTAVTGASYYRVYQTTTSGSYTSANYFTVTAPTVTFTDTGGAASGTATPSASTATAELGSILFSATAPSYLSQLAAASANYGTCLSLGSGPFDGVTSTKFAGSASGTILAINAWTGYAGNPLDIQIAGASKFKIDSSGNSTIAGGGTTAFSSKTTNYTITTSDSVIIVNGASLVITLPSAAAVSAGRVYEIKNNNQTGTTIKTSTTGQTIDGTDYSSTGFALSAAFGSIKVVGDGTSSWYVL